MTGSPVKAQDGDAWPGNHAGLASALAQMKEALRLLDESEAPAQIGAQLDLAIQQLEDEISKIEDK